MAHRNTVALFSLLISAHSAFSSTADTEKFPIKDSNTAFEWFLGGYLAPMLAGMAIVPLGVKTDVYEVSAVGGALFVGGALVGPSLGQFYAHSYGPGLVGILARGAGLALVFRSIEFILPFDDSPAYYFLSLFGSGILVYSAGAMYSGWDTFRAVARFNAKNTVVEKAGITPGIRLGRASVQAGATAWVHF